MWKYILLLILTFNINVSLANEKTNIVLIFVGELEPKTYFDTVNNAVKIIQNKYKDTVDTNIVTIGHDQSLWYDKIYNNPVVKNAEILIVISNEIAPFISDYLLIEQSKKVIYIDYKPKNLTKNEASVFFKDEEFGYLAGYIATLVAKEKFPEEKDTTIGFIGGKNIMFVNNILVGYIDGAKTVDENVKIKVAYLDSWTNVIRAVNLSSEMYDTGSLVNFIFAGEAGYGALPTASSRKKYIIGANVDVTDYLLSNKNGFAANYVITSIVAKIDLLLLNLVDSIQIKNNRARRIGGTKFEFGKNYEFGVQEGFIDIAMNTYYLKNTTPEIRTKVNNLLDQMKKGKVKIKNIRDYTPATFESLVNSVK